MSSKKKDEVKIDNSIFKRKIKIAFFSSDINQAHSVTYFLKKNLIVFDCELNIYQTIYFQGQC